MKLATLFAIIIWFSVIAQFFLMMENRTMPVAETVIRFFSFFTILTNTLAAVYCTTQAFKTKQFNMPGTLTAVTVYITIVGVVYQILLRHIWQPTGLQRVVDELLHSINPVLLIIYWYYFEQKALVKYKQIFGWMLYPIVYLIFILMRGSYAGFYPYPFVDVAKLGLQTTLINSFALLLFFALVACIYIAIGHFLAKRKTAQIEK